MTAVAKLLLAQIGRFLWNKSGDDFDNDNDDDDDDEMQKIGSESRLGLKNRIRISDSPKRSKKFVFRRNRNETKISVLQKKVGERKKSGLGSETDAEIWAK